MINNDENPRLEALKIVAILVIIGSILLAINVHAGWLILLPIGFSMLSMSMY